MEREMLENYIMSLCEERKLFPGVMPVTENGFLCLQGRGKTSFVYEMYSENDSSKRYAVKVIPGLEDTALKQVIGTVRLQRILANECEFIADIVGTKEIESEEVNTFFILMNKYTPVVVRDKFGKATINVPELNTLDGVKKLIEEIGEAIIKSHLGSVMHRDIKLENIFYDEREDKYLLSDFGVAKRLIADTTDTIVYTNGYGAPEIEKYLQPNYTFNADVYSFGMVIYLLLNDLRFPGSADYSPDIEVQYNREFMFPAPAHAVNNIAAVLRKMCAYDPEERYALLSEAILDIRAELTENRNKMTCMEGDEYDIATEAYEEETKYRQQNTESIGKRKKIKEDSAEKSVFGELGVKEKKSFNMYIAVAFSVEMLFIFLGLQKNNELAGSFWYILLPVTLIFLGAMQYLKQYHYMFALVTIGLAITSMIHTGPTWQGFLTILCAFMFTGEISWGASTTMLIWRMLKLLPISWIFDAKLFRVLGWGCFAAFLITFLLFFTVSMKYISAKEKDA